MEIIGLYIKPKNYTETEYTVAMQRAGWSRETIFGIIDDCHRHGGWTAYDYLVRKYLR